MLSHASAVTPHARGTCDPQTQLCSSNRANKLGCPDPLTYRAVHSAHLGRLPGGAYAQRQNPSHDVYTTVILTHRPLPFSFPALLSPLSAPAAPNTLTPAAS